MKRMKSLAYPLFASALLLCGCNTGNRAVADAEPTLKEALDGKFLIGTSVNVDQQVWKDSLESQAIASQFNTIVAENCMKCEVIHPERDRYDFTLADEFVKFGEQNHQYMVGHCLIWHSQLAPWFCVDEKGNNVSADTLKLRMKNHIQTVVGRYKGRIKGWDVVNEPSKMTAPIANRNSMRSWVRSLFRWHFNMRMRPIRMPIYSIMIIRWLNRERSRRSLLWSRP
jgi:Beta-1,4-xylanase